MKKRSWYGLVAVIVIIALGQGNAFWKHIGHRPNRVMKEAGSPILEKMQEQESASTALPKKQNEQDVISSTLPDESQVAAGIILSGKQEKAMPTKSLLEGKIICIDAGHQSKGNSDREPISPGNSRTKAKVSSGTKGVATGKYEYELNLEVALKLKEALLSKKAIVYMVRETNDVDISNAQRAEMANKVKADLSLRIHADGSDNSSANGFSILVPGGIYVNKDIILRSRQIAEYIEKQLVGSLPNESRGIVTREDLTGFNWCEVPSILVEMGFMSNAEEDLRMSTNSFQDTLVQGVIEGLEAYYSEK